MGRRPPPLQSLLAPLSLSENVTMTEKEGGKEKNGIAFSSLSLGRAVLPPFSPAKRGSAAGRSPPRWKRVGRSREVEEEVPSPLSISIPPPFSSPPRRRSKPAGRQEGKILFVWLPSHTTVGVVLRVRRRPRVSVYARFSPSPPLAPCPKPNFFKASFRVARRRQRRRFLEATRYALATKKRGGEKKRRFAAVNSLLCSVVPRRRRHIELNDARAGPGI